MARWWLWLVLGGGIVGAAWAGDPSAPGERRFRMGFTPWPYDYTTEAVQQTYQTIGEQGDLISHHIEEGIPWAEALEGRPFPSDFRQQLEKRRASTPPGHRIVLALNPLNIARNGLAGYRNEALNQPLPPPWNEYDFGRSEVKLAYLRYCRRMADFFKPDYLVTGIEVNLLLSGSPDRWAAYVELQRFVRAGLKQSHPNLPVVVSFLAVALLDGYRPEDNHAAQLEGLRQLLPHIDWLGLSVYPHVSRYLADPIPASFWDDLTALSGGKPIAVTESGYPGATFSIRNGTVAIAGTEEKQSRFIADMLRAAELHDFRFVVVFTHRDYDALWLKLGADDLTALWKNTGLYNSQGQARAALAIWRSYLLRPVPAVVAPPLLVMPPVRQIATAGHQISLTGQALSDPPPAYRWQISSDHGDTWASLQDDSRYGGTGTGTLTITNVGADLNGRQYRLTAANPAGTATSPAVDLAVSTQVFPAPQGIAVDADGRLWVSDAMENTLKVVAADGTTTLIAGTKDRQGAADGQGPVALFRQPAGLAVDAAGNIYVADSANSLIRKVTPSGSVTTFAGSARDQGHRDGTGNSAWFNNPQALAFDGAGNLLVADTGNSVIRKITPVGEVTTLAGSPGDRGSVDGFGSDARFNQPAGIAAARDGTCYVADTMNQTIRRISPGRVVSTWAGLPGVSGAEDGPGASALFNQPRGLALDGAGNLYAADTGNATLRQISPNGLVLTLAGLSSVNGQMDGAGANAWFTQPRDVKSDGGGVLYVADTGNASLRRVSLDGTVATVRLTPAVEPGNGSGPPPGGNPAPPAASGGGGGGAASVQFCIAWAALVCLQRWRTRRSDRKEGKLAAGSGSIEVSSER